MSFTSWKDVLTEPVTATRHHGKGATGAPITLLEFGNYQCPFCGMAYPVVEVLRATLGDEMCFAFRHRNMCIRPIVERLEEVGLMRFRWHPKHPPRRDDVLSETALEAIVIGEARAILQGRVVDQLWAAGDAIPPWAWLNALAHRPIDEIGDLVGVACDQPGDRWADAVVDIALDLGQATPAAAAQIQAELFVPAHLEALAGRIAPDGPGQLVRAVRRRLASDSHRPPPNLRKQPDESQT